MNPVVIGTLLIVGAVVLFTQALFTESVPRISKERRLGTAVVTEPLHVVVYRALVTGVDRVLKSRGWVPFRASELEMASVTKPLGVVVTWVVVGSAAAFLIGSTVTLSPVKGAVFALLVPVVAKLVLRYRAGKRRAAFAAQLDNTLRIVASALRAGQSLPIALGSVAADAEAPMSEEITRVINENRLGRDLVEAMRESAERMKSEDFEWFAGAVEVQRDAGGNLNDIIDTVAETIRERAEIREKIRANAAEGKASAYVLMGLPVVLAVLYTFMNPGYLDPLFVTTVGRMLLALSTLLYIVAFFWMRAIVNFKV